MSGGGFGIKPYDYLTYRRRKCVDCGEKFNTFEFSSEHLSGYEKYKENEENINKLVEFLESLK